VQQVGNSPGCELLDVQLVRCVQVITNVHHCAQACFAHVHIDFANSGAAQVEFRPLAVV